MRLVFAGSPSFAVPSLKRLLAGGHEIVGVVTQPARPAGRGRVLTDPPVKAVAAEAGLEVHQPEKFNAPEFLEVLAAAKPDLIITAAYGRIFRRRALDLPRLGCVNLHASLLPAYRGVAPINWAIINGESETGVTTFFMDEGVDTGDIVMARRTAIGPDETAGELTGRLADLGAEVLAETCDAIARGSAARAKQDPAQGSYAPKLAKEDGRVTWGEEAAVVHNRIRGVSPWPGAFCDFRGQRLKLAASRLAGPEGEETEPGGGSDATGAPRAGAGTAGAVGTGTASASGKVIAIDSALGILVSCRRGAVWIGTLQAQGKRPTGGADFARGYRVKAGDAFG